MSENNPAENSSQEEPENISTSPNEATTRKIHAIRENIQSVLVGQEQTVDLLLASLLAEGHVLLEGVPGIAKTLLAQLLAKSLDLPFARIQFTPDLMPSDILGTHIFNQKSSDFELRKGPIFAQVVLIDEINRAPAKTQSALFEVMEERQVTLDGEKHKLDSPFIVLATQNPIEQEGTYRLPEAQLDRFMMKINMDLPSLEQEIEILKRFKQGSTKSKLDSVESVLTRKDILEFRSKLGEVTLSNEIIEYIAKIVQGTRQHPSLYLGGSPRASLALMNASRAIALINNRTFVIPEDIKEIAFSILNHRLMLTADQEMEGTQIAHVIDNIMDQVEVPR